MPTNKCLSVITFFSLFLFSVTLMAQKDYHWDTYGVGFSIPNSMKIDANNAEEFEASNDDIYLGIYPFDDNNINQTDLYHVTNDIAVDLEYDHIEDGGAVEIDDFEGYYVIGLKDDVAALIVTLLDKESDTNLFIVIAFAEGFDSVALNIAKSFYAYDE